MWNDMDASALRMDCRAPAPRRVDCPTTITATTDAHTCSTTNDASEVLRAVGPNPVRTSITPVIKAMSRTAPNVPTSRFAANTNFLAKGNSLRQHSLQDWRATWLNPFAHRACCTLQVRSVSGSSPGTVTPERYNARQPRSWAR